MPERGGKRRSRRRLPRTSGPSSAEPGCLSIAAYRSSRDAGLVFHSRWVDEAAFEIHAGLPHTVRFLARVEKAIDHPVDVSRTEPL